MSRTLTRFSRFRMQWIWQRNRFHRGWELGTVGQSPRKQKTQNASNVFEVCSQIQLTMKLRLFIFFSSFLLFFGKTPEKWLNFNFFPLATCHYWNFLLCNSISHPTKWEDETISSHIEKPHRIGIGKKLTTFKWRWTWWERKLNILCGLRWSNNVGSLEFQKLHDNFFFAEA